MKTFSVKDMLARFVADMAPSDNGPWGDIAVARMAAWSSNLPFTRLRQYRPAPEVQGTFPSYLASTYQALPVQMSPTTLQVAVAPEALKTDLRLLEAVTQRAIERIVAPRHELLQAIAATHDSAVSPPAARPHWPDTGVTFEVAAVERATTPLSERPFGQQLTRALGPLEGCSDFIGPCIQTELQRHALIYACYLAFCQHRPLVLSPDAVWLTLAQGLAQHINANPEDCRHLVVSHSGQMALEVLTSHFRTGAPDHRWDAVVAAFSDQVRKHIGAALHDVLVGNFSTTGLAERVASEIVLMDAVQAYFTYRVVPICGLPSVRLEGTPEDWESIRRRFEALRVFNMDWWIGPLLPVLDEFVRASRGNVNRPFWNDIYMRHAPDGGYGGPHENFTGWVGWFIPYLGGGTRNPLLLDPTTPLAQARVPPSVSSAPVRYAHQDGDIMLAFVAGLLGIEQDLDSMAIRPKIGWAIRRHRGD